MAALNSVVFPDPFGPRTATLSRGDPAGPAHVVEHGAPLVSRPHAAPLEPRRPRDRSAGPEAPGHARRSRRSMARSRALARAIVERKLDGWRGPRRAKKPPSSPEVADRSRRRGTARGPAWRARASSTRCSTMTTAVPFVREAAHEAQQSLGRQRVEVREGLVKHDEARHQHERARDGHLLRLAARELVGGAFGEVLQLGPGDHATERLGDLGRRDAKVLGAKRQLAAHGGGHELLARILEHCTDQSSQVAQPKLPRRAAVDANAPGHLASIRMRDQAVQRADERALAAARRASHQEHLARLDAQRQVADGRLRGAAVLKGEVVDLDRSSRRASVRRARCEPVCRGPGPGAPPRSHG